MSARGVGTAQKRLDVVIELKGFRQSDYGIDDRLNGHDFRLLRIVRRRRYDELIARFPIGRRVQVQIGASDRCSTREVRPINGPLRSAKK